MEILWKIFENFRYFYKFLLKSVPYKSLYFFLAKFVKIAVLVLLYLGNDLKCRTICWLFLKNDTLFIETFLICWLFILWNSRPHVISRLSLLQDLVKELDLLLRFSYLWNLCVSKYPEPSYIPLWEMRQKKLNFLKFWILELCCFQKSQFFKSTNWEHFFPKISGNGP